MEVQGPREHNTLPTDANNKKIPANVDNIFISLTTYVQHVSVFVCLGLVKRKLCKNITEAAEWVS